MAVRPIVFKVILIGEGGVGKTSIVVRYTENRFEENMKMTIGANFASKKLDVNGSKLTLMLWDLGGQPRFYDVIQDYFKGSRIALAVYDATRNYTLERLDDWIRRVKGEAPECDFMIIGNKADQIGDGESVSRESAIAFASKYGADCLEVSARSGEGVVQLFEAAAALLAKKYLSS